MTEPPRTFIEKWTVDPQRLFLLDSIGALVTAGLLVGVLANFEPVFGMPRNVLYGLAGIAGVFCLYSLGCFLFAGKRWRPLLKAISIANLLYCCLTFGLVILLYPQLTIYGVAYFLLEIAVVMGVVWVEWRGWRR